MQGSNHGGRNSLDIFNNSIPNLKKVKMLSDLIHNTQIVSYPSVTLKIYNLSTKRTRSRVQYLLLVSVKNSLEGDKEISKKEALLMTRQSI